jgi:general secretion pathway protein F/type IV pilus assembly protein PilC
MKFQYRGIELSSSQTVDGEIDAQSESDAVNILLARQVEVFKLDKVLSEQIPHKKVTLSDLALPLKELATLSKAGVSLLEALHAMARNKEHGGLARGFKKIASLIESGESLSSAIKLSSMPFPSYVHYLVSAGELSGELAQALRNASTQLEYDQSIRNDLKGALTYPLVLIGAGIAAVLIIFFAVVPKFAHMLNNDTELPLLAWLVLSAGKAANDNPVLIGAGFVAFFIVLGVTLANKQVRHSMLNGALRLPVIGPWLAEQDAARWSGLCGAMLTARVELTTALRLAASSGDFTARKQRALSLISDVQSGVSLTESIDRANLLPGTSLNLISVGEKTGQLAKMFVAVANLHDEACKRRMKQVLTLIEPIAILIVGVVIGIMILGIVLAITASTDIAI